MQTNTNFQKLDKFNEIVQEITQTEYEIISLNE